MRKIFRIFFLLACCLSVTTSCVKENWGEGAPEGEPIDLVLDFGAPEQGLVSTKATLRPDQESTIFNMYVFIFDSGGGKIYGKYFDATSMGASQTSDYWTVSNYSGSNHQTTGSVHLKTIARNNCTIVLICNIDAEMVNISPEQLGTVQTYEDLINQRATLNQLIVSRSGYFPMTGQVTGFNIGGSEANHPNIILQRLDAKIKFNVRVAPGSNISDFVPLKWQVINIPKSAWILERGHYSVDGNGKPNYSQSSLDDATGDAASDYFNLSEMNFETQALTVDANNQPEYYKGKEPINSSDPGVRVISHGFSFYMMENRKAPKTHTGDWTYEDRERQVKNFAADREAFADLAVGDFKFAPDRGTYVIITGQVTMYNETYQPSANTAETDGATLSAEVKYVIHLGDFSDERYQDFNIFRNHTYTYDISIKDVRDIKVEVSNNEHGGAQASDWVEDEPAATGRVTVAMEEVFPCDAHYSSHIIKFHANFIDPEKVTWKVQTPFNPSGASPEVTVDANGVVKDNTAGIDFEWVEFRVNWEENEEEPYEGHFYDNGRAIYKPMEGKPNADGKTMNISGLVDYLKTQTRLWKDPNPEVKATSDFSHALTDDDGPYIPVTAFVNEYYYEVNPITKNYESDLWKSFVNKGIRYMYILSDSRSSADGESEIIGSSFTIQQKSIQTIYNISHPTLQSAWGCEHTDDEEEAATHKYWSSGASVNRGNNSLTNGRSNTLKEWELLSSDGKTSYMGKPNLEVDYWSRYMDLTADNEVPLMRSEYRYLRYSCMSRNRDNNGNGIIDEDEVRWYMGATNQLIGLFMGDYGLEGDARLYQRTRQQQESVDKYDWRQHVLASTCYGSNSNTEPRTIWAEQCLTGSTISMSYSYAGGMDRYGTRCLRNLGSYTDANGQEKDITYAPVVPPSGQQAVEPENYIIVTRIRDGVRNYTGSYDANVYYEFDCSRLNEKSLRYYTNRELVMHDEHGEQACLYKKFQAAPVKDAPTFASISCNKMNENIDKNIEANPYCPPGYRLCNIREASVLRDFIPSSDNKFHLNYNFTRTYWSYGLLGDLYDTRRTGNNMSISYAFGTSPQKVLMTEKDKQTTQSIRCVKDIKD
jgi:hypothetical protein